MGLFTREDSPWFWMFLEGTRKKERIQIRHDATDPDIRKANRLAAEGIYHARMVQLAQQRAGLPIDSTRTFSQQAAWYRAHVLPTLKNRDSDGYLLAKLEDTFGSLRLSDVLPARVREYEAARLAKGRKRSTVNQAVRLLKAVLASAIGEHLTASPLADYRQKRPRSRPKRTVEATEEPALLSALKRLDPELHDAYVVAVGTLLRQENVLTLTRAQHRGDRLVVETKTGPHVVSLTGPTELQRRAAKALKARWPKTHTGPFFPTWHQACATLKPREANARLLRIFRKAVDDAGLPWGLDHDGLVWHSATRATGATRLMRDYGVDIRTVQRMGPWASLDQMATYLGVSGNMAGTKRRNSRKDA